MKILPELKYTQNDEWIRVEGKVGTVGITDYAQEQLSDIVFVEVTAGVGEAVAKGAVFANVESVKAAAEVYMPVGGKVIEINEALPSNPEWINSDAYGQAWMVKIEITDPGELAGLMDAGAYEKHCQERSHG
ncbi:MAG: glycine cleavage system protein GcvH [Chloroflexota bacterium]